MAFLLKELRFSVPWGHLAAKAWGPSEGRPILCLHGWLDNANTFDRLIPLLPKDNYYVSLDFSGHGQSSHMPIGMRYQHLDYLTDVHRVVTSLGWRRFSILAHSMGGVVGGMFASVFPETVQQLILLDSYGFFPVSSDLLLNHAKKAITHYSRLERANGTKVYTPEGALQRLLEGNSSLNPDTAKVLLQRGTKPVPGGVVFSRDIRITVNNSLPLSIEQCLHILKSVQAKVHVILANEGISADLMRGVYTDMGQALLRGYRENLRERFQSTIVDGNHFVHLNEPEKIAKIIVNELYERPYVHSQL
ncbi:serine hydrolase-like protein 2 [Hyla sarda]|uniref:serine hydrolase-like protein 2 n=1 Tax=Hyla sarda TaxID=327740 RepID=UPI0024C37634|nr:serine hydrolase-like protein 2 [Hyla sarda]XP_056384050.1 serine hydrolase-like protein 2 [Hyla sarda]